MICPGFDDIYRPFILITDVIVQIEAVTITDVLTVIIFAFLLFIEGLITQRTIVSGDREVAESVNIERLIFL